MSDERFEYLGDPALRERIGRALSRVIDPEMAIGIVELGLVYRVEASGSAAKVAITMTSAACPVAELIVADIDAELREVLGEDADIDVDIVWDPPWGPERMSAKARSAMAWE